MITWCVCLGDGASQCPVGPAGDQLCEFWRCSGQYRLPARRWECLKTKRRSTASLWCLMLLFPPTLPLFSPLSSNFSFFIYLFSFFFLPLHWCPTLLLSPTSPSSPWFFPLSPFRLSPFLFSFLALFSILPYFLLPKISNSILLLHTSLHFFSVDYFISSPPNNYLNLLPSSTSPDAFLSLCCPSVSYLIIWSCPPSFHPPLPGVPLLSSPSLLLLLFLPSCPGWALCCCHSL